MPCNRRSIGGLTFGALAATLLLVALSPLQPIQAQQGRQSQPGRPAQQGRGARPPATAQPTQPPAQVPIFRSGVGAVLVDFKATDRQGRFISDLTAADVQVFEDGVEQQISTFSLVNVPTRITPAAPPRPGWPEPDTTTNADADGRLYLIALDDVHVNPHRSDTVQQLARAFITRHLAPNDRAALVATSGRYALALEFTNSQARLLAAVDRFVAGFGAFSIGDATSNREAARSTFHYLESMAKWHWHRGRSDCRGRRRRRPLRRGRAVDRGRRRGQPGRPHPRERLRAVLAR